MADVTTEIALEYSAKMGELVSELKKLPGISDKEVSKTTKLFDQRMREATKAAKRAAAANQDAWKNAGQTAEGFKRIADAAGGSAAGYAGQIEHLAKSAGALSATLGPAGVAAVAAAVGLAALGAAGFAAATKTSDLVEELRKAHKQVTISDVQIAAVKEMDRSIEGLTDDISRLTTEIGAEFAPALQTIVDGMRAVIEHGGTASRVIKGFVSLGLTEVLAGMGDTFEIGAAQTEKAATAARKYAEGLAKGVQQMKDGDFLEHTRHVEDLGPAYRKAQKEAAELTAELAKQAAEMAKQAAAQAAATEGLEEIYLAASDTQLSAEEKIIVAMDRKIAKIIELGMVSQDQFLAESAAAAVQAQATQELLDLEIAASDKAAKAWIDAEGRKTAAARASAAARHAAELKLQADIISASSSTASAVIGSLIQIAEQNAQVKENMSSAEREHALKAFNTVKALSIVQAGILGAVAIMQGFAQMGPIAGAIAAVGVGAMTAAQIAVIASKQPPEFAIGGTVQPHLMTSPDHTRPVMTDAEEVLTRRGVNANGGPEGVAAANRGEPLQPIELVMKYKQHHLDRVLADNLLRGGPLDRRIRKAGRRTGHRRSTT